MRKTEMISLGLMLVLFAGLFVGLGEGRTADQINSTRGIGPVAGPERSSADEIGTSPTVKLAEVLNSTAMKQGYFVPVAEISATGRPGFEYYDPVSRSACFDSEGTYVLHSGTNESVAIFSSFVGSSATSLAGLDPINTKVTRMIGRNESNWVRPQGYQSIQWTDLWPGVDLVYTGVPGGLKSQFWFDRESDYRSIAINISGAQTLEVSADGGELTILTSAGNVTESAWAWEQGSGRRIGVSYGVSDMIISFDIDEEAEWDAIVLDPLVYSTFLGGSLNDQAWDIFLNESTGEVYIAGSTASTDFPTTAGALNTSTNGGGDAFVTKIAANGSTLLYSTFIGGSGSDLGEALTVDGQGRVYLVCAQNSADFPVTPGAFNVSDDAPDQGNMAVLRLSANGSILEWSGIASGNDWDRPNDIIIDPITSDIIICGFTESNDFPVTAGAFQGVFSGYSDGFIARIAGDGTTWINCTYIGGTFADDLKDIVINSTGYIYFGGSSLSSDFPVTNNAYDNTSAGNYDLIYGIFSSNLSVLHVSGYLGGGTNDKGGHMALWNNSYVIVSKSDGTFPTTLGAYDTTQNGGADITVSVLNKRLDTLMASTYIGASANEEPFHVVLDKDSNVYVCGISYSSNFPVVDWAFQHSKTNIGGILFQLTYDLANLSYSTFIGGSGDDYPKSLGIMNVDDYWARDYYIAGYTDSSDFPTSPGAFNGTASGGNDAFCFVLERPNPYITISNVTYTPGVEIYQNWTIFVNITAVEPVTGVELRYNSSVFVMNSTPTPQAWNYTVSIRTTTPGSNIFQIFAASGSNDTLSEVYTFYIGNTPQYASISAPSTVFPATPWTVVARVTDELVGDSGVAGVHFRLDSGDWEPMAAEGDVYTADSRSFSDEGTYYWQLRAIDGVGNIAYSSSYKLVVSEETLPTTAAAAVVTTANGTPPWVPTYKADWGWWVYSFVFGAGILMFALLFGKKENNTTVNALITILTATAAGIMAAASLAGISRVFGWEIVAAIWASVGVWALVVAKKKLPAFAAGLAIGSSALGVEMLISSGWNLAVAMYICLAAAGAVWALGPKVKLIPKQRISIPIAVGVLMAVGALLGLWYVFV